MAKIMIEVDMDQAYDLPPSMRYADLTDDQLEELLEEEERKTANLKEWPDTPWY